MSTSESALGPDAIRQVTIGDVAMQVIDQKRVESLLAAERRTLEMIALRSWKIYATPSTIKILRSFHRFY